MARGGDDLAHTHSTQDGRIAHRVTQRNFSFGDKEFGVTLPLFKCVFREYEDDSDFSLHKR